MRAFLVPVLLAAALAGSLAGCATPIPSKDDFGASALIATGDIPPEFVEFNRFGAATDDYIAGQLCATPFQRLDAQAMDAAPGRFEQLTARCRTHVPFFGS